MQTVLIRSGARGGAQCVLMAIALSLPLSGCAPTIQAATESATKGAARAAPAVADAGLETLEHQQTRARVAAVLDTPEMQQSLRELSAGLSQGIVMGLSDDEMTAYIDKLVRHFTQAIVAAIDRTFDAMLSPEHEARIAHVTSAVLRESMRAAAEEIPANLAPAMHRAIVDDLGPAMHETMQKDVAAGVTDMIRSADVQQALGQVTREMAHQAVIGSNEGLAELAEKKKHDAGGWPIGSLLVGHTWLLVLLAALVVFGLPIAWLLRDRRLAVRYRAEAERRNARAAALLTAMEASNDPHWSKKVLELLREQLLDAEASPGRSKRPADDPPPSRSARMDLSPHSR